jgi:hypothetical protein
MRFVSRSVRRTRYAFLVAAGEACVRLRSSRKSGLHDLSDVPRTLMLRLLRSLTLIDPVALTPWGSPFVRRPDLPAKGATRCQG